MLGRLLNTQDGIQIKTKTEAQVGPGCASHRLAGGAARRPDAAPADARCGGDAHSDAMTQGSSFCDTYYKVLSLESIIYA